MRYIDKYSVALQPKASIPAVGDYTNKGIIQDIDIARTAEEPELIRWIIGEKTLRRGEFKVFSLYLTEMNPYGVLDSVVPDYSRGSAYGLTKEELKHAYYSFKNIIPRSFRVLQQTNMRYRRLCEEVSKGRDFELRHGVEFIVSTVKGENEYVQGEQYALLLKLPQSIK